MRRIVLALAALSLVAVACKSDNPAVTTSPTSGSSQGACTDVTGGTFAIGMHDNVFQPTCVIVKNTQALTLTNEGAAQHNFSIEGSPTSKDLAPGETANLSAPGTALPAGTYTFFCRFHRSQGMVGELRVQA